MAVTDTLLIEICKVMKVFRSGTGEFRALDGVNLSISQGEFVAIVGKSGSGKSTLMNMITGIDRPTSGEVRVGGKPLHTMGENDLSKWRGRNIGIVFQFFQLLPTLTVIDNIMLPMDFCGMYPAGERRRRAMSLLELVDMEQHAHKLPTAISGGQQQRVAIARSLANDPPLIAADEPTGNLDSKTAADVFGLFTRLTAAGKTIVMVTHDADLAARTHRAVRIADGNIIEDAMNAPGGGGL